MTIEKLDYLIDMGYEDSVTIDGFDEAIIGVSTDGQIIYDYDLMVDILHDRDDMTLTDAAEYIDYNVIRALPYTGDLSPIVVYRMTE